jgi:hypothetical protein
MTIFEYLSVAIAIVVSFAVVRLLDGVSHAADSNRRYWPHLVWIGVKFLQCFNAWWILWASRDVSWDYGRFLVQLGPPLILYLQATALVTSTPQSVESWSAHYYAVRRRFFSFNFFLGFAFYFAGPEPEWITRNAATAVIVSAISITGLASDSRRLHSALAVIAIAGNMLLAASMFAVPNPLGP